MTDVQPQTRHLLDARDLLKLADVLKALPGVKPRLAQEWLLDQVAASALLHEDYFEAQGLRVSLKETDEFLKMDVAEGLRVTPKGAQTLIELYERGALPMRRTKPGDVPSPLRDYVLSQAELEQRAAERRARDAAQRQAYEDKLNNPQAIEEAEFTFRLLDDLFWKHVGKGAGSLEVGGLTVHKSLVPVFSNSGKSRDFSVTFSWTSPLSGPRTIDKESVYAGNRRNDEKRDWGLPE